MDLTAVYEFHRRVSADATRYPWRRYLFDQLNAESAACLVYGFRGVGKTTMLLQYAREHYRDLEQWLYITADFYPTLNTDLYTLVSSYFAGHPGKLMIIDEVQKFPDWKVQLKNVLDAFKDKKFLVSGSSSIELIANDQSKDKSLRKADADLARRISKYVLEPLSFREYLNFSYQLSLTPVPLPELLKKHSSLSTELALQVSKQGTTILAAFSDYLAHGCYPFYFELKSESEYFQRLAAVISNVIESDIGTLLDMKNKNVIALKKLLSTIASSKPFSPDISKMAQGAGISRPTTYQYLAYLDQACLTRNIYPDIHKAYQITSKPEKICLSNPNLLLASRDFRLNDEIAGALRESFFVSNFSRDQICSAPSGDFIVDSHVFEIGGPNKGHDQLPDVTNSFVVKDRIEISYKSHEIPLYLFGFLY